MQDNTIPPFDETEPRNRVCVVDGWGIELKVRSGHLLISDGIGRHRRERRFNRATHGLDRIVLIGHTGYLTLEAIRWITGAKIELINLDHHARLHLTTTPPSPIKGALRKAQADASTNHVGTEITRRLLTKKLEGQRRVALRLGGDTVQIEAAIKAIATCPLEEMMPYEAQAAATYWAAWRPVAVHFARSDHPKIPDHWHTFGTRKSPVTGSGRRAANPANAILNYLYALLEAEATIALTAVGLDTTIGLHHANQPSRHNLTVDLIEAARPTIDAYLLDLLEAHTFRKDHFHEDQRGVCRINPPLTHRLSETTTLWAPIVGLYAEDIAADIAKTADLGSLPTWLTGRNRAAGRGEVETSLTTPQILRMPGVCKLCGTQVEEGRRVCEDCHGQERADHFDTIAAKSLQALASLRLAGSDPAHGGTAATKRGESVRRQNELSRKWTPDPWEETLDWNEVVGQLERLSVRKMMDATGLSSGYCSQIKRGIRVPHLRCV